MGHPAKFSDAILEEAARVLWSRVPKTAMIIDTFAGTGKGVEFLYERGWRGAIGFDLEEADAWNDVHRSERVFGGTDALALPMRDAVVDCIFTSPTYGNRFADRDMRESCAGTYMKGLQREAADGSSAHLQWGPKYRAFHEQAWAEVERVLKPSGLFLLNISDHYRDKRPVPVTAWHVSTITAMSFEWIDARAIATPRMTRGANSKRCEVEWLMLFAKRTAD